MKYLFTNKVQLFDDYNSSMITTLYPISLVSYVFRE